MSQISKWLTGIRKRVVFILIIKKTEIGITEINKIVEDVCPVVI